MTPYQFPRGLFILFFVSIRCSFVIFIKKYHRGNRVRLCNVKEIGWTCSYCWVRNLLSSVYCQRIHPIRLLHFNNATISFVFRRFYFFKHCRCTKKIENELVVITGPTSGIGLALACDLAKRGTKS